MQKTLKICIAFICCSVVIMIPTTAQKYFSKNAQISFHSKAALEDIESQSQTASTVMDTESQKIQWAVLIKSFNFEKALMQEHFNENYMESSKYPKSKFKGTYVSSDKKLDFSKDGEYPVEVEGQLSIHGVTKAVKTNAIFIVEGGKIRAKAQFKVLVADYKIDIPSVVKDNIAKEITIDVLADYELFEKNN